MDSSTLKHILSFKSNFLAIGIPNIKSVCPFTVDYVIEFKLTISWSPILVFFSILASNKNTSQI